MFLSTEKCLYLQIPGVGMLQFIPEVVSSELVYLKQTKSESQYTPYAKYNTTLHSDNNNYTNYYCHNNYPYVLCYDVFMMFYR